MGITVEELEKLVAQLPQDQPRKFRAWYEKFGSDAWEEQIEKDAASGKLDALAEAAVAEHRAGKEKQKEDVPDETAYDHTGTGLVSGVVVCRDQLGTFCPAGRH